MKKYIKKITTILIVLVIVFAGFVMFNRGWKTYTSVVNPYFSFRYPSSWGEARLYNDTNKQNFQVDFGNYGFAVSNGYYFADLNGKRPTIRQLVDYYQKDKDLKNEVKDFSVKSLKVDNYPAVEVVSTTLSDSSAHHTDVYIYKNNIDEDSFILVTASSNFVNDNLFDKILSTFKLEK